MFPGQSPSDLDVDLRKHVLFLCNCLPILSTKTFPEVMKPAIVLVASAATPPRILKLCMECIMGRRCVLGLVIHDDHGYIFTIVFEDSEKAWT